MILIDRNRICWW